MTKNRCFKTFTIIWVMMKIYWMKKQHPILSNFPIFGWRQQKIEQNFGIYFVFWIISWRTKIVPNFSAWLFFNQKISFGEFTSLKPRFFEKFSKKQADISKINMNKWNQNHYSVNLLCVALKMRGKWRYTPNDKKIYEHVMFNHIFAENL